MACLTLILIIGWFAPIFVGITINDNKAEQIFHQTASIYLGLQLACKFGEAMTDPSICTNHR